MGNYCVMWPRNVKGTFEHKSKESKGVTFKFKPITEFIIQVIEWRNSKR